MPQFLLELLSEEIPARMQAQAALDLERMAREKLGAADLDYERLMTFAGPRRLTLVVDDLPAEQQHRSEERKGPRVGAPDAAIDGFLRSTGIGRGALTVRDGVYFAAVHKAGQPTAAILAEMTEAIVRGFPWPKSMTWSFGKLRWVRPLQRILCVFDREIVHLNVEGLESGDISEGHRFMGPRRPFRARDFDEYREALAGHFVMLDAQDRRDRILTAAREICDLPGLELVDDEGLLDEVSGLAEWPVPILGQMDPDFLTLPPEVIRTSMRTHQKYFAVRYPAVSDLAPHFVVVANIEAEDGGALVAAGNARVLSARLQDARFFWDEDLKVPLASRLEKLKGVTFHAQLGTMYQRVERIEALARQIAPLVGANPDRAVLAARLAKADLASGMVGEFPELQGVMGAYYARAEALGDDVANAIGEHYKPQGPSDDVPTAPVSVAVALADKLDTLAGFFSIGEKPTGSRDPYALRRAALGVIRIVLQLNRPIPLKSLLTSAAPGTADDIMAFLAERLRVLLRDQGRRYDLVDAVFALGEDNLVRVVARIEALGRFLGDEDGANLLAGHKRASNILTAEVKKGFIATGAAGDLAGAPAAETALIAALGAATPKLDAALKAEDFAGAMRALSALRAPVDAFFEQVLVNSQIAEERDNRLRLLSQVRSAMDRVADFSKVSG